MSAPKTDNCPFCGSDKHMVLPPNCTKIGDYNPGDNAQPIVRCMTCYAEAMGDPWDYTKETAIAAWNRRTDLQAAIDAAKAEARAADAAVSQAAQDVIAERQRQISAEGWTPEHDDKHSDGEMAAAAACYALVGSTDRSRDAFKTPLQNWPWAASWWKPTTPRRDLVKAGALIIAEIARLDRAAIAHIGAKP